MYLGMRERKKTFSLYHRKVLRKETRNYIQSQDGNQPQAPSQNSTTRRGWSLDEHRAGAPDTDPCRGLRPGRMMVRTAPRRCRPGERSHPCTAGSLSSEARCTHCNSNHTLERKATLDQLAFCPAPGLWGCCLQLQGRKRVPHKRCQISEL